MTEKPFVIMLSGQGAQKPGMGADLQDVPLVADTYACASDIFGFDVLEISQSSAEILDTTPHAQAALVTLSLALARVLEQAAFKPQAALGFSLGQISALNVTGMLGMEETFMLTKARAGAMERAARVSQGAMCALLGADKNQAQLLCEQCAQDDVLVVANYNCPGQIVISGSSEAIDRAHKTWSGQGGRAVVLATAGAFHSPLMQQAADDLESYLKSVEFAEPTIPLICNTDATPLCAATVSGRLVRHMTSPVYFQQSVESLFATGSTHFVEAGFGGTLSTLVRRIDKNLHRKNIQDKASLTTFISEYCNEIK